MSIALRCTCGWGGYCTGKKEGCTQKQYSPPPERKIFVTNCYDCPFRGDTGWDGEVDICKIEGKKGGTVIPHGKRGTIEDTPKWCPLKKEEIRVVISHSNTVADSSPEAP